MTTRNDLNHLLRADAERARIAADRTLDPDYETAVKSLDGAKRKLADLPESDATTRARLALSMIEERGGVNYLLGIGVVSTIAEIKAMMKRGAV